MKETDSALDADPAIRVGAGGSTRTAAAAVLAAARNGDGDVPVFEVGGTGVAAYDPLVVATVDGTSAFLAGCTASRARDAVEAVAGGSVPDAADLVVEHDPDAATLPLPADGPLSVGDRRVLAGAGWAVPASAADYQAETGGFVCEEAGDSGAIDTLDDAGLLGRGRGDAAWDAPVAAEWRAVESGDDPVVVVNANEADPRARMDQLLLETAPLKVLDPALAAARAVGADAVVVYVNEADELAASRTRDAAASLREATGTDESVEVVAGPDSFRAGEVTMALESLEGNDRLEARRRPPGPSSHGLFGRPTLVHTPRTLAQVGELLRGDSGESGTGSRVGDPADPGTRVVTVGGDVADPLTTELPTDESLSVVRDGVDLDGYKAACVGGAFGGLTRNLDVSANVQELERASLGTNGVVELFDSDRCLVAVAGHRATFARDENCGRCVPCREGSKQLTELVRGVYDGDYDEPKIEELTRVMGRTSLCAFGREAARPVRTAMAEFGEEFAAHADGRCPTGACEQEVVA